MRGRDKKGSASTALDRQRQVDAGSGITPERDSVELKWHTLLVVGSLGIFAGARNMMADDNMSAAWQPATGLTPAAASANVSFAGKVTDSQRQAQELVRQALVEMDANRFASARQLARRAAAMDAGGGKSGIRPDQLLAEIDRREREAAAIPRGQSRGHSYKAQAIELLDHGLTALEEKRYEDAEQFARQASQLPATWDKYDYRPQDLLQEIRKSRPQASTASEIRPASDSGMEVRPVTPAYATQSAMARSFVSPNWLSISRQTL